jgi:NADH-quinone oxidoreductase subunit N
MSSFNFEFLVPELFFSLMLLLLLFWGSFFQTKGASSISVEKPVTWLIIWLFLCFVFVNLSFGDLLVIGDNNSLTVYLINGVLVLSPFTSFIKTCIGFFSFCVLFAIFRFFNIGVIRRYEFPIIIGFASFGIILLVSSNDIISVYLAIETQALATYVIAGYSIRSAFSTESGLKYFVIGSLSSGLFLLGSVLLYLNLGSTFFPDMHSLLSIIGTSQMSVNFGFLLVIVALFFKLGIAPFHMWLPDVYQGAPTPSVIFFAVVSKLAVFALVVRFCIDVFEPLFGLVQPVFLVFGILSLLIGSFGALFQKTLKRFLAFSSISHSGYLLLTVASHNTVSVQSFLIYSVIYIIMGLCVWTIVANLVGNYTFFHKIPNIKYIADLSGLVKIHPILAILISLLLFSIAGIPPLAGFFSKYSVFLSILNSGFIVVSVFVAFCSMIGAFYYLRWVKIIYADRLVINAQKTFLFDFRFSYSESLLLSAFCLFIVLFFIDPQPLLAYFYFISIEFL